MNPDGQTRKSLAALAASAALGMVLGGAMASLASERTAGRAISEITLKPEAYSALGRLELVDASPDRSMRRRLPITDLMVRIKTPTGQSLGGVLAQPDASSQRRTSERPSPLKSRRSPAGCSLDERVECGAWQADLALCRGSCDGGVFAIERRVGDGESLGLTVGQFPSADGQGLDSGVRLGHCRDGGGNEATLLPHQAQARRR